jgi:hypothetical protein
VAAGLALIAVLAIALLLVRACVTAEVAGARWDVIDLGR